MHYRTPKPRFRPRTNQLLLATLLTGFITTLTTPPCWSQVINEDLKLLPHDGSMGHEFGQSIAIDNGIVAVGARNAGDIHYATGSAYLFDAFTGIQLAEMSLIDGAREDIFGYSIAIEGGVVAVGAPWRDVAGNNSGAAYLFSVPSGDKIATLLPTDGAPGDAFGISIAIDKGIVAVGSVTDDDNGHASGSAYLFNASTGVQIAKLLPSDGAEGDWFGHSIAIDNGVVAVGAPRVDDLDADDAGSAYLFDALTGLQIAKLLPSDGALNDEFGYSIAINNGIVAVGAWWDDDNGTDSGSVYLFDASTGVQIAKLLPGDGQADTWFGWSVAIDNGIVAVGTPRENENGHWSGSAYLFDASTNIQIAKLLASDGEYPDHFGWSIAFSNGVVAAGASKDRDNDTRSGSAYLFNINPYTNCLSLTAQDLIAGQTATFKITQGTPNAKAITVYGTKPGTTKIQNIAKYCATFGINNINQSKIIGGSNRTFDQNGQITFNLKIPNNTAGLNVLFQSAQHNTCPEECMSSLVKMIVQ